MTSSLWTDLEAINFYAQGPQAYNVQLFLNDATTGLQLYRSNTALVLV